MDCVHSALKENPSDIIHKMFTHLKALFNYNDEQLTAFNETKTQQRKLRVNHFVLIRIRIPTFMAFDG